MLWSVFTHASARLCVHVRACMYVTKCWGSYPFPFFHKQHMQVSAKSIMRPSPKILVSGVVHRHGSQTVSQGTQQLFLERKQQVLFEEKASDISLKATGVIRWQGNRPIPQWKRQVLFSNWMQLKMRKAIHLNVKTLGRWATRGEASCLRTYKVVYSLRVHYLFLHLCTTW